MIDKPDDNNTKTDHKTLVETIKENLPNPTDIIIDQTIYMFIQWYNRRILILSSVIMIGIPIYMIIIGVNFFHSCPKSFYLPLHMIICGTVSLIAAILLFIILIVWKKAMKLTCHTDECITLILSIFEIIFLLICSIGLIILTIILVKISNTVELINQTFNYCHPIIYYSSYILLFSFYIILSIIMIIFFFIFHAYQKTQ